MQSVINFKPWVGDNYNYGNIYGKKIMVLGESHYGTEHPFEPGLTTRCVLHFEIEAGDKNRFYRMVPPAILKKNSTNALSHAERVKFWNNVLFYNYIQEYVHDSPGGVRNPEQWKSSEPAFYEVLNTHQPDLIIAFGYSLGNNLPMKDCNRININGLNALEYKLGNGHKIILVVVRHPAGGMSYKEVHNTLELLGL